MKEKKNYIQFYLLICIVFLAPCISKAQCGGFLHNINGSESPGNFQIIKEYKVDSKGLYEPRIYILQLDSGLHNVFIIGKNPHAKFLTEVSNSKKNVVFENTTGFGNSKFIIPKSGWYYLSFTSIEVCSICDCAIAYLSRKTGE
ncbi:MAG: hypothetical protein ACJAWV_001809 [Flammeovirgaceae bacterium]|jgi:hypothetical protein